MSRTFNGTTDKGAIASALLTSLASTAQFHIAVWAKTDSLTALGFAFTVSSSSDNDPIVALGLDGTVSGDKMYALVRDSVPSGGAAAFYPANGYAADTWHLLTLRNFATNSRLASLDADFANAATAVDNQSGAFSPNQTSVGVLRRLTESGFFDGKIARIAIWRGAATTDLPDADDQQVLALGADPSLIKSSTLVYHWDNDLAAVVGGQSWTFTGTTVDSADNPPTSADDITAATVSSFEVPAGGAGSLGFTNTGIGYDVTNNELLVGDFTNGRIARVSQAGAYIGEIVLAGAPASSVQGVAWDSSDGTYWVCHYAATNGTIRHYNSSGTLLDTFSPGVAVAGPNGCTYDAVNDRILAVWNDASVRGYSCSAGTLVESVTLDMPAAGQNADGLVLDPLDPTIIWATVEQAGTRDFIKKYDRATGALLWLYECDFDPEDLCFIQGTLWMCADQDYHSAVANGNRVRKLDIVRAAAFKSSWARGANSIIAGTL